MKRVLIGFLIVGSFCITIAGQAWANPQTARPETSEALAVEFFSEIFKQLFFELSSGETDRKTKISRGQFDNSAIFKKSAVISGRKETFALKIDKGARDLRVAFFDCSKLFTAEDCSCEEELEFLSGKDELKKADIWLDIKEDSVLYKACGRLYDRGIGVIEEKIEKERLEKFKKNKDKAKEIFRYKK